MYAIYVISVKMGRRLRNVFVGFERTDESFDPVITAQQFLLERRKEAMNGKRDLLSEWIRANRERMGLVRCEIVETVEAPADARYHVDTLTRKLLLEGHGMLNAYVPQTRWLSPDWGTRQEKVAEYIRQNGDKETLSVIAKKCSVSISTVRLVKRRLTSTLPTP